MRTLRDPHIATTAPNAGRILTRPAHARIRRRAGLVLAAVLALLAAAPERAAAQDYAGTVTISENGRAGEPQQATAEILRHPTIPGRVQVTVRDGRFNPSMFANQLLADHFEGRDTLPGGTGRIVVARLFSDDVAIDVFVSNIPSPTVRSRKFEFRGTAVPAGACLLPTSQCDLLQPSECGRRGGTSRGGPDCNLCPATASAARASAACEDGLTFVWQNPAGGSYSDAANWDPEGVPAHDGSRRSTAVLGPVRDGAGNVVTSYAVTASGATATHLEVSAASVALRGAAEAFAPSSFGASPPSVLVHGGGNLTLPDGARLAGVDAHVGSEDEGAALSTLAVTGRGSDVTVSNQLVLGGLSPGKLTMSAGATVSAGVARIGSHVDGQANLTGDGTRLTADSIFIGSSEDGTGTAEVGERAEIDVIGTLRLGELGTGTLRVSDGGAVRAASVLLGEEGGFGTVELAGGTDGAPRSRLEVAGLLHLAQPTGSRVRVADGSVVIAGSLQLGSGPVLDPTRATTVEVSGMSAGGAPSQMIVNASGTLLGSGDLVVHDGARAEFVDLTLGAGGETVVDVRGRRSEEERSFLVAGRLTVGFDAAAVLAVTADGIVDTEELSVGSAHLGGVGRVRVTDEGFIGVEETLRVSGDALPDRGADEGVNVIIDRANVTAGALRLGDEPTEHPAEVLVRAAGILLTFLSDEELLDTIGDRGPGILRLEDGGDAVLGGDVQVGNAPAGGSGEVSIGIGSFLGVDEELRIGGRSPGTVTLEHASSELRAGRRVLVGNRGVLQGVGNVTGPVVVRRGGLVAPGLLRRTPTVESDFVPGDGATLPMEAAGREPGRSDVLRVRGAATLGGRLELRFLDGFLPKRGDSFALVQADGGREGVFDEIVVRDVAPGFDAVVFDDGDGGLRLTALADAQAGQGSTVLLESPGSPGSCAGVGSGATFASLDCRLDALFARLGAEDRFAVYLARLVRNVESAKDDTLAARRACTAASTRKARRHLVRATREMSRYVHRLHRLPLRIQLDAGVQRLFLDEGTPIRDDLRALRDGVRCP